MATWSTASIPTLGADSLTDGIGLGSGIFVFTGTNGQMRRSADYGATWSAVMLPEPNDYAAIASDEPDGTTVVAVGYNGTHRVIVSTDQGATWSAKMAAAANSWVSVCSPGVGVFVAVSTDGTDRVMRSIDGGNTWSSVTVPLGSWCYVANNGLDVLAVSTTGTTIFSNDGGVTWTSAAPLSGMSFTYAQGTKGAIFCTAAAAFAVGGEDSSTNAPKVAFTYDRGATWSYVTLDPTLHKLGMGVLNAPSLNGMFLGTPFNGSFAAVPDIGISTDAGATFPVTDPGVAGNWPISVSAWDNYSGTLVVWDETPTDTILIGAFDLAPSTLVTSVLPNRGTTNGGTSVTIHGSGFTDASHVRLGGSDVTSFRVVNDTTITAVTQAHSSGLVDVTVSGVAGDGTLVNGFQYDAFVAIDILSNLDVRRDPEVTVTRELGSQGNTLNATVETFPIGASLLRLQDPVSLRTLYGGSLVKIQQAYQEGNARWSITGNDYRWLLGRRYPLGSWTDTSATTIIQNLIDSYSSGFTYLNVVAGMPNVSITFNGTLSLPACFDEVLKRCGQSGGQSYVWGVDDDRDIHAGVDSGIYEVVDFFSGDGSTNVFNLRHHFVLTPGSGALGRGYVTYDDGTGPVNETLALWGSGLASWEIDTTLSKIRRTAGTPVAGTNNIQIIYSTDQVLATIDDNDPYLLRVPDEPSQWWDWFQIRNRVIGYGKGTTTVVQQLSGSVNIRVADASMFVSGCKVKIGDDILTVDYVYNGHIPFADPTADYITLTSGTSKDYAPGTSVRLYVELNDTASQTALALIEGGDGIHESPRVYDDWTITSDVLDTGAAPHTRATAELASITALLQAEIDQWSTAQTGVTFYTENVDVKEGMVVTFSLTNPPITGSFRVQTVRIFRIHVNGANVPALEVTAAGYRFGFNDLINGLAGGSFGGSGFSSGGGGGGGSASLPPYGEEAVGTIDGVNTVFTTTKDYVAGSLKVTLNGIKLRPTVDYTETSSTGFSTTAAPFTGGDLWVDYLQA